jgi:hypothetical protein
VANAVGTLTASFFVYQNMTVPADHSTIPPYVWILALGASGIVVGLATYGYNVMRTLAVHVSGMPCAPHHAHHTMRTTPCAPHHAHHTMRTHHARPEVCHAAVSCAPWSCMCMRVA